MSRDQYDIFISFKNSDSNTGKRTKDSELAEKLYNYLGDKGLRVFFSNKELEFTGQSQYSRAIESALDSSRFLVVVGCSRDNVNSEWVRSEWEGFVLDIKSGIKPNSEVFVLYQDMTIRELPLDLRHRQAFDASDHGCYEKLHNFISNALRKSDDTRLKTQEQTIVKTAANSVDELSDTEILEKAIELNGKKEYDDAFPMFMKVAETGNSYAQEWVGHCYRHGQGIIQNDIEAFKWYFKSAEAGRRSAQYTVGESYQDGIGVKRDVIEAKGWYQKAVAGGHEYSKKALDRLEADTNPDDQLSKEGMIRKARELYEKKEYDDAFQIFKEAAEEGGRRAQEWVGHCYRYGKGVTKNENEAFRWYYKPAEAGRESAQCGVASCYENGIGVEKDIMEAIRWYQKAAARGHKRSKENLERLAESVIGRDEMGRETGATLMYPKFTIDTAAESYKSKDYETAINQFFHLSNDPKAQYYIGLAHDNGHYLKEEKKLALYYILKSAEEGLADGQFFVGNCYRSGTLAVKKDLEKAEYWLKKAAEQGNVEAKIALVELAEV